MEDKICVFCRLPITDDHYNEQVQVVFGGYRQYPKGKFMIKQPGIHIFYHEVCGVPGKGLDPSETENSETT